MLLPSYPLMPSLQYFNGDLMSTNVNGMAQSVNFLDGGGAAPLMQNMAANDENSKQYTLVTHLYQIFGSLLGCSMQNATTPLKSYMGNPSMSQVHRFMNLDHDEMNYFIQEVGRSATSFGVSQEDAMTVGNALNEMFNYRCLPPASLGDGLGEYSQSCCLADGCPTPENKNCTQSGMSFPNGTSGAAAQPASSGSSMGGGSGSGDGSSSTSVVNIVGALALASAGLVAVGL